MSAHIWTSLWARGTCCVLRHALFCILSRRFAWEYGEYDWSTTRLLRPDLSGGGLGSVQQRGCRTSTVYHYSQSVTAFGYHSQALCALADVQYLPRAYLVFIIRTWVQNLVEQRAAFAPSLDRSRYMISCRFSKTATARSYCLAARESYTPRSMWTVMDQTELKRPITFP